MKTTKSSTAKPAKPKPFVRYIRDKKRNPVGTVVVFFSNRGDLKAGYSKLHKKDAFDKQEGRNIAFQRSAVVGSATYEDELEDAPHGVGRFVAETVEMAQRFYSKPRAKPEPKPKAKPRKKVVA